MNKHIEHVFIPQSISHISKKSNNPQDFVQEIRELNNHILGSNIISEVLRKKQNNLFHSDSRTFQIINNQSIKQDSNELTQQKNEQVADQHSLRRQQMSLEEHRKQQNKLLQRISRIVQVDNDNLVQGQKMQLEDQKEHKQAVKNFNNNDQRNVTDQSKPKGQLFDMRFDYKRDQNSTDAQNQGFSGRQIKILKHKEESNIQFLMTQIKQILTYNKYFLLQIEKMQTRRKIAETQIEIRKLKIGMRNHAFTKTINYTSPIKKHNDTLIVKSPKKTDPKTLQNYQYLIEKISQIKCKYQELDNKQSILTQYYEHLKSKDRIIEDRASKQQSIVKANVSRSKLKSFSGNQKSPSFKGNSKKSLFSLKTIAQTSKNNTPNQIGTEQDTSQLGQKAVLILKRQTLKDSLFDYQHFFINKQQRLNTENNILAKQIQILNSHISNLQVSQHIWKDRIKYQNQVKKEKENNIKKKRFFEFTSAPKNSDFTKQLRNSKTPTKNNFNFTFKATDLKQANQNFPFAKFKPSLRQVTKKIKISRQNMNSSRNLLSVRMKKSKSQEIIFQSENNLAIQNSSKKGTIKTQQSLDRNSFNNSAQNEYYNNQIL